MDSSASQFHDEYSKKMKGLILFRALFALLLLGSSLIYGLQKVSSTPVSSFLILLGICTAILILSILYFLIFRRVRHARWFAYIQLVVDSIMVTLIVFVTGSFISVFSFLYLIVIICSSMFLLQKGSLVIAMICSLQYSAMLVLEYRGTLIPFDVEPEVAAANLAINQILYKIFATVVACFTVAFLSSILAEQEKKTKKELLDLEDHVKRVEKNAAMGEMAAGLAHEIKNPLASLSGSIQLLKEEIPYDPGHDKLMQIVLREADRLSRLVSDFLLFARPKIGKLETFNVNKFLVETVELFKKDMTCKGKVEYINMLGKDFWLEMDPGHLRQVLWNLYLNAAYSIGQNGIITISLYPVKKSSICIEVKDTGCGMSENTLKSIFDPFYTTRPEGTGLGLSIVQRILASYDCQLYVESKIDIGTVFTLKLKQVASHK